MIMIMMVEIIIRIILIIAQYSNTKTVYNSNTSIQKCVIGSSVLAVFGHVCG